MNQDKKEIFGKIWEMRRLTVREFLSNITDHPDLGFLLTTAGIWFVLRLVIGIWIATHVIYFVCRVFNLVMD